MAVVAFTSYTDQEACGRSNTYIADGHGLPPAARTNRYIGDGHGGTVKTLGHKCPSDPVLATVYMEAKRRNYERQHVINPERKKSSVTHIQLFVSPTEEDHVPPEERLEMTRELIERTILKDFPSIYTAHDNTPQGHCHISVCPFSEDGSHKLCMNNKLLYDLRRQMDYICVEHGYSIIECPELWGDKTYRQWFFEIKERNVVAVHPPREQNKALAKIEGKRERNYNHSKRAQKKQKELLGAYYRELTKGYTLEKDALFYTSSWLYHPADPNRPLCVRRITEEGKFRSDLDLQAASLGVWAYHCEVQLAKKNLPGTEQLQKRLHTIMGRAYNARKFLEALDIRTQEELVLHIKECGQDIGMLKREQVRVDSELAELLPAMGLLERWEETRDKETLQMLHRKGLGQISEREAIQKQHARLLAKKESYQKLLEDRNKEYRNLKETEKTLNPASSKEAWESYLSEVFSRNVVQQAKYISADYLEERIYELGLILGIPEDTLRQYVVEVLDNSEVIRSQQFREYRRRILSARKTEQQGYDRYYSSVGALADLWELRDKLAGFGLLGFLLSLLVESLADIKESVTKMDLSMALWDAGLEKWYAEWQRGKNCEDMPYHPEVHNKITKERREVAARIQRLVNEMSDYHKENYREKLPTEDIEDGTKNIKERNIQAKDRDL